MNDCSTSHIAFSFYTYQYTLDIFLGQYMWIYLMVLNRMDTLNSLNQSQTEEHFGYFQFLSITNNTFSAKFLTDSWLDPLSRHLRFFQVHYYPLP